MSPLPSNIWWRVSPTGRWSKIFRVRDVRSVGVQRKYTPPPLGRCNRQVRPWTIVSSARTRLANFATYPRCPARFCASLFSDKSYCETCTAFAQQQPRVQTNSKRCPAYCWTTEIIDFRKKCFNLRRFAQRSRWLDLDAPCINYIFYLFDNGIKLYLLSRPQRGLISTYKSRVV